MKKLLLVLLAIGLFVGMVSMDASAGDIKKIVIIPFSLEGTKIQKNPDTELFAEGLPRQFVELLKDELYTVHVAPEIKGEKGEAGKKYPGALVIEGNFTKITAGSTAARMVVGFGAGSSTVGAAWVVKDGSSGKELGKYKKNAHTSSAYTGSTAIESDARYLARHVAKTIAKHVK